MTSRIQKGAPAQSKSSSTADEEGQLKLYSPENAAKVENDQQPSESPDDEGQRKLYSPEYTAKPKTRHTAKPKDMAKDKEGAAMDENQQHKPKEHAEPSSPAAAPTRTGSRL